jgi:hypothetical protein
MFPNFDSDVGKRNFEAAIRRARKTNSVKIEFQEKLDALLVEVPEQAGRREGISASRFLGSLAVRRSKAVAFFWNVASEFPPSRESAINAATALSTVNPPDTSG